MTKWENKYLNDVHTSNFRSKSSFVCVFKIETFVERQEGGVGGGAGNAEGKSELGHDFI